MSVNTHVHESIPRRGHLYRPSTLYLVPPYRRFYPRVQASPSARKHRATSIGLKYLLAVSFTSPHWRRVRKNGSRTINYWPCNSATPNHLAAARFSWGTSRIYESAATSTTTAPASRTSCWSRMSSSMACPKPIPLTASPRLSHLATTHFSVSLVGHWWLRSCHLSYPPRWSYNVAGHLGLEPRRPWHVRSREPLLEARPPSSDAGSWTGRWFQGTWQAILRLRNVPTTKLQCHQHSLELHDIVSFIAALPLAFLPLGSADTIDLFRTRPSDHALCRARLLWTPLHLTYYLGLMACPASSDDASTLEQQLHSSSSRLAYTIVALLWIVRELPTLLHPCHSKRHWC